MRRSAWAKPGAALLLVALVALAIWKWDDWRAGALASSAYAARHVCSCRYVAGRSAESCARDVAGEAGWASVTDRPEEKRVTARIALFGHAEARFRDGYGCLMEPR